MPSRFVLQPDGKLARFSENVDNFTHYDMSREDAFEVAFEDMGREAAVDKVQRGFDNPERWKEELWTIFNAHGKEKLEGTLKEMGFYDPAEVAEVIASDR